MFYGYPGRNAYSPRLRTCSSPSIKAEFLGGANPLHPCYVLPYGLSNLQPKQRGSTEVLPPSAVLPTPEGKNDGRTADGVTGL